MNSLEISLKRNSNDSNGKIYLIRHGHICSGEKGRYIGKTDIPLSALGISQINSLIQNTLPGSFEAVFASDLARSRESARIIANHTGTQLTVLPTLREIDLGCWDGLTVQEVKKHFPGEYEKRGLNLADYRPPGGESFRDVQKRIIPVFNRLTESTRGDILIVGHAGVNRAIICHLTGIPLKRLFQIKQEYASLTVINRA